MFVPQGVGELREAEEKERKTNWPGAVISSFAGVNSHHWGGKIQYFVSFAKRLHSSTDVELTLIKYAI